LRIPGPPGRWKIVAGGSISGLGCRGKVRQEEGLK
jgi:hypothetical protein